MSSRRKSVSGDEESFFLSALKDVKPLKTRRKIAVEPKRSARTSVALPPIPHEPAYNERPAPPIGGHADMHLRRGRIDPQGRIDLHGLTHDRAYRALLGFLWRAQIEGNTLVLVITGKGGVLRKHVPLWLGQAELRPLIAGVSEAHVRHGGGGAFYVALRKRKARGRRHEAEDL